MRGAPSGTHLWRYTGLPLVQAFISGRNGSPLRDRVRYSTEVPQRTWTEVAAPGRRRTVTCGDGRGWTCCRQMACKRSGVRISLAPLVRSIIRTDRTASTAAKYRNGGPMGRRTCVRIGMFHWRGLLARPRILAAAPLPPRALPGQFSFPGMCDTCCHVVTWLVRAVSRTVTIAVFAGGRSAAHRAPKRAPSSRVARYNVRVFPGQQGTERMARRAAPDGASPARKTASRLRRPARGCAVTQSGAAARRAAAAPPGNPRTADHWPGHGAVAALPAQRSPAHSRGWRGNRVRRCPHRVPDRMINNIGWGTAWAAPRSPWLRAVSTVAPPAASARDAGRTAGALLPGWLDGPEGRSSVPFRGADRGFAAIGRPDDAAALLSGGRHDRPGHLV